MRFKEPFSPRPNVKILCAEEAGGEVADGEVRGDPGGRISWGGDSGGFGELRVLFALSLLCLPLSSPCMKWYSSGAEVRRPFMNLSRFSSSRLLMLPFCVTVSFLLLFLLFSGM